MTSPESSLNVVGVFGKMIKKILFATDLSAFTTHTLVHVETLARQFDATVCIVHAVRPIGELASAVVQSHCSKAVQKEVLQLTHLEGLLETIRDSLTSFLRHNHQVDLTQLVDEVVVASGQPANVILLEAERIGADLIVVGSHSTEAIDGRILGSVASKVLQLAKVPVLMVPMMNPTHVLGAKDFPVPSRYGT